MVKASGLTAGPAARLLGGDFEMSRSRTYTREQKADALARLAAEGGNVKRAALAADVPRKTLEGWGKGRGVDAEVLRMTEESKKNLAEKFMREAEGAVDAAAGKRDGASYRDLMIGAAVAVDKAQLLSGAPTAIIEAEHRRQTAEQALDRLVELARQQRPGITKAEVRDVLIARRPELRPLLLSDSPGEGTASSPA